jgi:hypothetical protein
MKDIFSLKLYTRVARLGSFSAAARDTRSVLGFVSYAEGPTLKNERLSA